MKKNLFIIFEGIDGCGKTTLINYLKGIFTKRNFFFTKEPFGSEIAISIKNIIYESTKKNDYISQALTFALDRSYHIKNVILPQLEKENCVISDRFIYSGMAYQGLNIDYNIIESIYNLTNYNINIDKTFFCDIHPKIALERIQKRNSNDFLDSCYETKLYEIQALYKKILSNKENVIYLDMNDQIENIAKKVINNLNRDENK